MSIQERSNQYETVFGDWHIDKFLGKGGMGGKTAVYRLTRMRWGITEYCAMKIVNLMEQSGNKETLPPKARKEYEEAREEAITVATNEVQLMYTLAGNQHIVTYFDFNVADWQEGDSFGADLFIRMELMEKSLDQVEAELYDYNEAMVYSVGKSICSALESCHRANIIHRDIKPANIFLSKSGTYYLGDFGVAKIISSQQGVNTSIGTRAYAAPEQFSPGGTHDADYDERVDLYSLALTLYELCNEHHLPFSNTAFVSHSDITRRIKGEKLPPPSMASPELAAVILKACAYRTEDRYRTAADMCAALEAAEKAHRDPFYTSPAIASFSENAGIQEVPAPVTAPVPEFRSEHGSDLSDKEPSVQNRPAPKVAIGTSLVVVLLLFGLIAVTGSPCNLGTEQENTESQNAEKAYELGYAYYNGSDEVGQDHKQAVSWFRKSADQGYAEAQNALGCCYAEGNGVEQDYGQAFDWFQIAAVQGNAEAQYNVGICLYSGNGVDRDYKQAIYWYQKAADQGHAMAQRDLGLCYLNGAGVRQDYGQAMEWVSSAAEQGCVEAQHNLGIFYRDGYGTKQDSIQAVFWFREAAEHGYALAQNDLGVCYAKGWGVTQDDEWAAYWYRQAASQGCDVAQYNLAECYLTGNGVAENRTTAIGWYRQAASQGNEDAQQVLVRLGA